MMSAVGKQNRKSRKLTDVKNDSLAQGKKKIKNKMREEKKGSKVFNSSHGGETRGPFRLRSSLAGPSFACS
jgi:hypothetical protein